MKLRLCVFAVLSGIARNFFLKIQFRAKTPRTAKTQRIKNPEEAL